jgi:hypothetical protein
MTPREQVIQRAAQAVVNGVRASAAMTPRAAAEAAWYPGHPLKTVDAIEAAIRKRRAEDAALITQAGQAAA